MCDILIECDKGDLSFMLKILEHYLPEHIQQYNFVYNYFYHYEKINQNRNSLCSDRWNVRFYRPRNGTKENCTLISINGKRDYVLLTFTLQESQAELKECLQKTELIDWNNEVFFMLMDEKLFDTVNGVARKKLDIDWIYPPAEIILHMSKEKILELPQNETLPDNLYLAPLDAEKHFKIINNYWPYKHENSEDLIRQSIEFNVGMGIFRRGEEQPICWTTTNEFFTAGFHHTIESERRKGYGNMVLIEQLKRLVKLHNIDLFSVVSEENLPSLALRRKLGFRDVTKVKWIEKPQ